MSAIRGTGYMLGSQRFGPFGRCAPGAFGHLGLVSNAVWADPERGIAGGLITSGKPGRDPDSRYRALMNTITAQIPVSAGSDHHIGDSY